MNENKEMEGITKEYFGVIIKELEKVNDYEELFNEGNDDISKSGSEAFNIIPYDKPSKCHERLVVVVDGKNDINGVLSRALKHVGISCKGKTIKVLFYVACNMNDWGLHWVLLKSSFDALVTNNVIEYWIYISKRNTAVKVHNGFKIDLDDIKQKFPPGFDRRKILHSKDNAEELSYSESLTFQHKIGSDTSFRSLIYYIKFITTDYVNLYSFTLFYLPVSELTARDRQTIAMDRIARLLRNDYKALLNQKQEIINICFSSSISDISKLEELIKKTKRLLPIIKGTPAYINRRISKGL